MESTIRMAEMLCDSRSIQYRVKNTSQAHIHFIELTNMHLFSLSMFTGLLFSSWVHCLPGSVDITPLIATRSETVPSGTLDRIHTPSPVMSGMVNYCAKFHLVKSEENCSVLAKLYQVSISDILNWNKGM